ncbi:hypothetical protein [Paenibacillus sp. A3]|nr:hypothetical protein [Paenibacillus sp. A3]
MNPFDGVDIGLSAKPLYIFLALAFGSGIIGLLLTNVLPIIIAK